MINTICLYLFQKNRKILENYDIRETLNKLMMIQPMRRTSDQDLHLAQILMEYPTFQYVMEDSWDALISLSKEIYMKCLPMETEVIKQGDDPNSAYLMIHWSAQVTLTMTFV